MIGYVVKKPGRTARAFLIDKNVEIDSSPEETSRLKALEFYYEGRKDAPSPKYTEGSRVVVIE